MSEVPSHALWRTCLHEYAHLVVARHFGAAGFVAIGGAGSTSPHRIGGRFQMYGELLDEEWRIVALAGAVAERVDEDPAVAAAVLADALRADPEALRGTDAELAAGFDDADVERCLDLVRRLWREIAGEATERFASETAHRRAARP